MVPGLRPEREGRVWATFEGATDLGAARSAAELLPSPGRRPLSPPPPILCGRLGEVGAVGMLCFARLPRPGMLPR